MSVRDLLDEYGSINRIPEDSLKKEGYVREQSDGTARLVKASKRKKQQEQKESLVGRLRGPLRNHTHAHHRTYEKTSRDAPEDVSIGDLEDAVKRSQWMKNEGVPPVFTPDREGKKRWIDDDGVEHRRFPTVDSIANIFTADVKPMPSMMGYAAPTIPKRMELLATNAFSDEQITVSRKNSQSSTNLDKEHHVETSTLVKDLLVSEVERVYGDNFATPSTKEYVLSKVGDVFDSLADPLQEWAESENLDPDVDISPSHVGSNPFWFAFVDTDDVHSMLEEYKTQLSRQYARSTRETVDQYMRQNSAHKAMLRSPFNSASFKQDVLQQAARLAANNGYFTGKFRDNGFTKNMFEALPAGEQDDLVWDYIEDHTPRPGDRARVQGANFKDVYGISKQSTIGERIWSCLNNIDETEAARRDNVQDIRRRHPYAAEQLQLSPSQVYKELDVETKSNKNMYSDVLQSVQGRARKRITGVPYQNPRPQSLALGIVDDVKDLG